MWSSLEFMYITFTVLLLKNYKLFCTLLFFCLYIEILDVPSLFKCLIAIKCKGSRVETLQIFCKCRSHYYLKILFFVFCFVMIVLIFKILLRIVPILFQYFLPQVWLEFIYFKYLLASMKKRMMVNLKIYELSLSRTKIFTYRVLETTNVT